MDDELKYMLMKVLYKLDELLKEIHENKGRSIPYAERGDERYRYSPPWLNQTICSTDTERENLAARPQTSVSESWYNQANCTTTTPIPPVIKTGERL